MGPTGLIVGVVLAGLLLALTIADWVLETVISAGKRLARWVKGSGDREPDE
jgi:hypothetical protein